MTICIRKPSDFTKNDLTKHCCRNEQEGGGVGGWRLGAEELAEAVTHLELYVCNLTTSLHLLLCFSTVHKNASSLMLRYKEPSE